MRHDKFTSPFWIKATFRITYLPSGKSIECFKKNDSYLSVCMLLPNQFHWHCPYPFLMCNFLAHRKVNLGSPDSWKFVDSGLRSPVRITASAHIWVIFWHNLANHDVFQKSMSVCTIFSYVMYIGWRLLSLYVTVGGSQIPVYLHNQFFPRFDRFCLDLFLGLRPPPMFWRFFAESFRMFRMFWCRIGTFWLIFSQPLIHCICNFSITYICNLQLKSNFSWTQNTH